jgi:hypothetical protein
LQVVGPVVVLLGSGFDISSIYISSIIENSANPNWLTLNIYNGGIALNSGANVYGYVTAPGGTVMIIGNAQIVGGVDCDRLTISNSGRLQLVTPPN